MNTDRHTFFKRKAHGLRRGFTMIEVIVVIAVISMLAAITVPSMVGFIEHGMQTNRMNVARTIYLAAQNQLSRAQMEKNLKTMMTGDYFIKDEGFYTELLSEEKIGVNNVAQCLGADFPSDEDSDCIRYVSKPKGPLADNASDELIGFYNLLDEIIMDKSILDEAILMEYNIRTGAVLSVFYGDAGQGEFKYSDQDERENIIGGRGNDNGYEYAYERRQGYYGAKSTGKTPTEAFEYIANIYDGAKNPETALDNGSGKAVNILYAEFFIEKRDGATGPNEYTLEIVDAGKTSQTLMSVTLDLNDPSIPNDFFTALSLAGKGVYRAEPADIYQSGVNVREKYDRYIWVIDYIAGDIYDAQPNSISNRYSLEPKDVRAKVSDGAGSGVISLTFANTHFARRISEGNFEVKSARHLNNIRYAPMQSSYRQTADIDMMKSGNKITNFAPISDTQGVGFGGEYNGCKGEGTQYKIDNLTIETESLKEGVGLFSKTTDTAKIRDVRLNGAKVRAENSDHVGTVAGQNAGAVSEVYVETATVAGRGNVGGIVGENSATASVQSSLCSSVSISATGDNTGGIAGKNEGEILKTNAEDFDVTGRDNIGGITGLNSGFVEKSNVGGLEERRSNVEGDDNVGGIAGQNSDTSSITTCRVAYTRISGKTDAGGVSGSNSGVIGVAGVEHAVVSGSVMTDKTVGGVAGTNLGKIKDVYFLSVSHPDNPPVSGNGGGIVGVNGGEEDNVENALYIAPAPKDGIDHHPIVRQGQESAESCFYLLGYRYSLNEGKSWPDTNHYYNRTNAQNAAPAGGGSGMISKFIDADWFEYIYQCDFSNWLMSVKEYPYPTLKGLPAPVKWPEADSPVRPDQEERDEENDPWGVVTPTSERGISPEFVNGDFSEEDDFLTNRQQVVGSNNTANRRIYVDMEYVPGWYTRPVTGALTPEGGWRLLELQDPINFSTSDGCFNEYVKCDYQGGFNTPRTNVFNPAHRYAELNADVQGTLYQVLPTTPEAKFYYSFYHTSRTSKNKEVADRMNFYLSPFDSGTVEVTSNGQRDERDGAMILIRPCQSPRKDDNKVVSASSGKKSTLWNTSARITVSYGASDNSTYGYDLSYHDGKSYLQPDKTMKEQNIPTGRIYLYDVWIGDTSGQTRNGYGLTFWSASNYTNLSSSGYTTLLALTAVAPEAATHTIGYWDVSYGWKHYYGMYEVPKDQKMTEFAFQSRKEDDRSGNYLDGISFKSASFISVDKFIKADGENANFVQPGDTLTVTLEIKNWGDMPADNIKIEDQLHPFNQYVKFVPGTVRVNGAASPQTTVQVTQGEHTVVISLPESYKLGREGSMTVTFDIEVRDTVLIDGYTPTLLYYFKNQAVVKYKEDSFANEHGLSAYQSAVRSNASGPLPVQVFIDPVKLTKKVTPESNGISNDPFRVDLTVKNTLAQGNIISTTGLVTDIIPKDFIISNTGSLPGSKTVYTKNSDGSTRITIRDVNLNDSTSDIEYWYELTYTGEGYGVTYTSASANYKYLYTNIAEEGSLDVMLVFPSTVVGINIRAQEDSFECVGREKKVFDIVGNDCLAEKLVDDNFDVTPVVMLTGEDGQEVSINSDGNYCIENQHYKAELIRGTGNLEFTPKSAAQGSYELYYKIYLNAQRADKSLELSSPPTKITVNVQ